MRDSSRDDRAKLSPRVWLGLTAAYLVAVPWYAPRDWIDPTLWALPAWAVVSVAGSVALAVVTGRALFAAWPDDDPDGATGDERGEREIEGPAP